ncbi:MAG TPA: LuxR C-terminal-related transcriptional regulator [Candidatus Baltobacteraceae bacterium]|nr:LuxR C-terminal-related transcriptional regulator [Candidatus Baltobacteraceae bacterium]
MRARINERLERATRYPVTLIVAPAGFGKSSALRDYLQTARIDAVRCDVRREDNSLLAFVHHLSEAIEPVAPSALAAFPSMQERVLAAGEPVRQISDWFAEHLKRTVCTIVIDDLHYAAADPASIALLADLIERSGDRIKWIIAARSDVGLPVGTWIAYGRMDLPVGEDELRFTTDEALAAADASAVELDAHEIESLRQLTEGWPVALTIAIRTRTHSRDLRSASLGTQEMVYRYLAEQVFSALTPEQQTFALATSVFSSFDVAIAERFGAKTASLQELRSRIAFLNETAPGQFRYHDLFRDFLETELRRSGDREYANAVCHAAEILEERGSYGDALTLYAKVQSSANVLRIVDERGFGLLERGEGERLWMALEAVPERDLNAHAAALGLKAVVESARGRFELAERRFIAAIEAASGTTDLQISLVSRYAIELVRHERDSIHFLEPYAARTDLTDSQRVPLLGTLATAYARAGRRSEALATIDAAVASSEGALDETQQARLYQQAAFVYHDIPDHERTRTYAEAAVDLALAHGLHDVAARAYSALFTIVFNEEDDPISSLAILDKIEENALKGASQQAHIFALIAAYEIEADRGDDAALERLDGALHDNEGRLPFARFEALLPASALRAAGDGDFGRAFRLLNGTLDPLSAADRRALRASEIALYAAAGGESEAAAAAVQLADEAIELAHANNRRTIRARVFLGLAELVRGHEAAAHRYLSEAEKAVSGTMRRMRALVNAARTVYRLQLKQSDEAAYLSALERLRSEHFGGLAKLLKALPASQQGHAYSSLTVAEREILQLLAGGASTKDVAGKTGRSPHTVDTHIRSICRKLNCSGRREAVALATTQGWVHT